MTIAILPANMEGGGRREGAPSLVAAHENAVAVHVLVELRAGIDGSYCQQPIDSGAVENSWQHNFPRQCLPGLTPEHNLIKYVPRFDHASFRDPSRAQTKNPVVADKIT